MSGESLEMRKRRFAALYTGQKLKKRKTFHDGVLVQTSLGSSRYRVVLVDEGGKQIECSVLNEVSCNKGCFRGRHAHEKGDGLTSMTD